MGGGDGTRSKSTFEKGGDGVIGQSVGGGDGERGQSIEWGDEVSGE